MAEDQQRRTAGISLKLAAMMQEIVDYLRDIAQTCTRLARACPDLPTSRGLEEIALDLMAKARELEQQLRLS